MASKRPKDENLRKLGDAIRDVRNERGLSQAYLAQLANIDCTYLGRVERGENNVQVLSLVAIAKALDTDVQRFMGLAGL